jgi:hypothetical protein
MAKQPAVAVWLVLRMQQLPRPGRGGGGGIWVSHLHGLLAHLWL